VFVCVFGHNSGTPGASDFDQTWVCVFVCMFGHNSGTPGAISTKLGTHITICLYKNLMYIYIYEWVHVHLSDSRLG
jgi:hypothetical protein